MSELGGPGTDEAEPSPRESGGPTTTRAPGARTALQQTPNAERYVLEADAMRRRQLRSALLHGSRRTWRENPRVWPAVVIGIIVAAVIVAGLVVSSALQKSRANEDRQEQQQSPTAPTSGSAPAPSTRTSTGPSTGPSPAPASSGPPASPVPSGSTTSSPE